MFTITVQDGEIVALCFSDWEVEPHRGKLSVSLLNTDKRILPSSFKYHLSLGSRCTFTFVALISMGLSVAQTTGYLPLVL